MVTPTAQNRDLQHQLAECAAQAKAMIDAHIAQHRSNQERGLTPSGCSVWAMLDCNGRPLLTDLVAARTSALCAMVQIVDGKNR